MALSKQDFIQQGFAAAQNTAAMTPGHEDSMPIFGTGNSWQAKAFAEGFRQGMAERHERNKGMQKGEMVVMTAKTGAGKSRVKQYGLVVVQSAQETAMCHIQNLALIAANLGDYSKRAQRIWAKIQKLTNKWGF